MPASLMWSEWKPLKSALPPLSSLTFSELLDGGQAFRWLRQPDDSYLGQWDHHVVSLRLDSKGNLFWRAPEAEKAKAESGLRGYLGCDTDFAAAIDALPWRSDAHLNRCLEAFHGLRILRQPFGETLLCFLCSATKQIVQIKQMVRLLAKSHGAEIAPGYWRLPTWPELAPVSEFKLRECLLGFRARFIHQTAQFLAAHPTWLNETERLPYPEAKARLCALPGVGEKVADCVLLFGAGRLEAFPVDVWILKTMEKRYGLESWKPAQVSHFGRIHFGAAAGLAQQFLFAWERREKKASVQE
jgi:N-glycosylase/DNA lyase